MLASSFFSPQNNNNNEQKGVCVALLCYDGNAGLNTYDVVKQCWRVSAAELKELYELSQVLLKRRKRAPARYAYMK